MADPNDAYTRAIDQAARTLAAANADWQRISDQMTAIPSAERETGGNRASEYAALSSQLDGAAKRFNQAEQSYQDAITLADKTAATAKEYAPAGESRQRLDTVGNTLVAITEVADGRGGWSKDPNTNPSKVEIPGVTDKTSTVTAAPTSEYVLRDGKLEKNAAYKPPTPQPGTAVPTSEFVYDANGNAVANTAYRPPVATISDAEFIPDPEHPGQFKKNPNFKTPAQQLTPGQAATDTAAASTAQSSADAALKKAQADADKAALDLQDAQRKARQAPTDAQAQQAVQQALDTAQQAYDTAQFNLDQARKLAPGAVAQQGANLASTQASTASTLAATQKAQLGDLYGLQDKIKQVRDLIASGDIKPEDGDQMIAAAQRGTNVYDAMKQTQLDRQNARTQDVQNKNSLASAFSNTFTSGLSTLADMNKYASVGSTAGADAFVSLLNMAQDRLKSYDVGPAQQTDYLGAGSRVGAMANMAAQPVAPPAPAPAPMPNAAQPITINIGGGAASSPQPQTPLLQPGMTGTANDPHAQPYMGGGPMSTSGDQLARAASQGTPATNGEVISTLFPNMAKRFGLLTE